MARQRVREQGNVRARHMDTHTHTHGDRGRQSQGKGWWNQSRTQNGRGRTHSPASRAPSPDPRATGKGPGQTGQSQEARKGVKPKVPGPFWDHPLTAFNLGSASHPGPPWRPQAGSPETRASEQCCVTAASAPCPPWGPLTWHRTSGGRCMRPSTLRSYQGSSMPR